MPRLVFKDSENFIVWLKTRDLEKYDFYRTETQELVAAPVRSTQPLMYAVIKFSDMKELKITTDFLAKQHKFIFEVSFFDWDSTKMPGVEKTYLDKS
jgi:hypothetical protein